jgi:hypothetical protein
MPLSPEKAPSPSRTYVACCNKGDFSGFYFRKFHLPEKIIWLYEEEEFANSCEVACWFYLNRLNHVACVEFVMAWEDYQDLRHEGPVMTLDGSLTTQKEVA